jgi:mitochondrial fission process protein 1
VKTQHGKVPAIEDYRSVMLQRAVFQGVASMGLPAFTIHSIVRYSGRALKYSRNTMVRTYGPIGVGWIFFFQSTRAMRKGTLLLTGMFQ